MRAREAKPEKLTYGQFGNVKLTRDEYDKLIARQGHERTQQAIAKLDAFIGSKGDKYKSHYMTMYSWVLKAVDEDMARARGQPSPGAWKSPAQRRLESNLAAAEAFVNGNY